MEITKKKTIIGSLVVLVILIASSATAMAFAHSKDHDDIVITYSETPENVKQFLGKHFPGEKIDKVVKDNDKDGVEYDIVFLNGTKVEVDANGNWEEVKNYKTFVPKSIIPAGISAYLAQNYPSANVVKISQSHKGFKVKLDNNMKLKFNPEQQLVKAENKSDKKSAKKSDKKK